MQLVEFLLVEYSTVQTKRTLII